MKNDSKSVELMIALTLCALIRLFSVAVARAFPLGRLLPDLYLFATTYLQASPALGVLPSHQLDNSRRQREPDQNVQRAPEHDVRFVCSSSVPESKRIGMKEDRQNY